MAKDITQTSMAAYRRFIFIMIDGAPYAVLRDLVASGELPGLARLAESGGGIKQAVTCFPSTTGPAYIPYFTGLFPGTANVPGYRWLSRTYYNGHGSRWTRPGICSYSGREALGFDRDLPDRPTWFDYFDSSRSIFSLFSKGCPPHYKLARRRKPVLYAMGHYFHCWNFADAAAAQALIAAVRQGVQFIACAFNGVDGHSHGHHPRSPKTLRSYRLIDRAITAAYAVLREQGWQDETLWVIGSDHGHSATHTHLDIGTMLEKMGFPCLSYPMLWRRKAVCAAMVSGNGMAHLYFRKGADWGQRSTWEEVEALGVVDGLLACKGIDFVAGRTADGAVCLRTATGEGVIRWQDGTCSYDYCGQDPLGCGPFQGLDSVAVLERTFDSPHPDACMQLEQIFWAERSGDLVVSATPGFDLRGRWEIPPHRSTHGALNQPQAYVPVIFSHPLGADRFRTVDVFPTALRLLGKEVPSGLDGRALD